ncbi:hypothetical protein GCM10010198_00550 [Nocardia seriolae]
MAVMAGGARRVHDGGMRIGVPREVKEQEYRIALTPAGAGELTRHGHEVLIEAGAGIGSGFGDADYLAAGARIAPGPEQVWGEAELVLKVKEPIAEEYSRMREGQVLFTFLHLAASRECTDAILRSGITAIAYETVRAADGSLPLLAPMSEVAGKLGAQVGAYHLMSPQGGAGVLLGGVPGVRPADVVVLGGGVAGSNAAVVAVGMGARVTVLDTNIARLRELDARFGGRVATIGSNAAEVEKAVLAADLVIGSVLVPGRGRRNWCPTPWSRTCGPDRCWWISPSIRAAASRARGPPRTPNRPSTWRIRCSTAWRTCRARCRTPPPSPSPTRRCPTPGPSRTGAGATPAPWIRAWRRGLRRMRGSCTRPRSPPPTGSGR